MLGRLFCNSSPAGSASFSASATPVSSTKGLLLFFGLALLLLNAPHVNGQAKCLYCVYSDTNAGFLDSFSYCSAIDVCLENAWNYIDYKCSSEWTKGRDLTIDSCEPTNTTCPGFESSEAAFGIYSNTTQALASGEMCTVTIDAGSAVARVIFDDTSNLGIEEIKNYVYGDPITVPQGDTQTFTIYNADSSGGSITFTLSFSNAMQLAM